jgi:hypothetical protein
MKRGEGKGEVFRFEVTESYTKANVPMSRLAEYMRLLAALLGESEYVHFDRLDSGSFVIVPRIDSPAVPKVRERLLKAKRPNPPEDVWKPRKALDDALAYDNAKAVLKESSGRKVLEFFGIDQPKPIGPIVQEDYLDGTLMWIGGHGYPVRAELQGTKDVYKCTLDRALAQQISRFLFQKPIRVFGQATWYRNTDAGWYLDHLRIRSFEELREELLSELIAKLRAVPGSGWNEAEDPIEALHRLRHGEG